MCSALSRLTVPVVALVVMVVALGAFAVDQVRPFLTVKRTVRVGTPVPTALFNLGSLPVPGRGEACLLNVTIPSDAQRATFVARSFGKPGPPLTVTMDAPGGYRSITRVAPGWGDGAVQSVTLQPPEESLIGRFCVRNGGRKQIAFNATDRPAPPTQQVNGGFTPTQMALSFDRVQPESLLDRVSELFHRASSLTWPGAWLLYVLAVALVIGVPLGVIFAFGWALRED